MFILHGILRPRNWGFVAVNLLVEDFQVFF